MQDLLKWALEEERVLIHRLSAVRAVILAYGGVPQSMHQQETPGGRPMQVMVPPPETQVISLSLADVTASGTLGPSVTLPSITPPFPGSLPLPEVTQSLAEHIDASHGRAIGSVHTAEHFGTSSESMSAASNSEGKRRRQTSEYTKRIKEIVADIIIKSGGGPVRTQHLVLMIENRGININGKNSVSSLSALLSHSKEFTPHGRSGWTLNENNLKDSISANINLGSVDEAETE